MGAVTLNLALGSIPLSELTSHTLEAFVRAPANAFTQGTLGLFTGLLAGTLFGVGGWVMDIANTSPYPNVSRYGPYVISLGLSAGVVAIAAFGPADALAKLG